MDTLTEKIFLSLLRSAHIPIPVAEHKFCETRRWRFDWAWIDRKIALEIEGGVWSGGRHTRGVGFLKDMEKYNQATLEGWRVFRTTPQGLTTQTTIEMLKKALEN
jgi:hypothetical protein